MSRSIHGKKESGSDFWSRRPGSGRGVGVVPKALCHRTERQQAQQAVRRCIEEVIHEPAD